MSAGTVIIFYVGILMIPIMKQIFTMCGNVGSIRLVSGLLRHLSEKEYLTYIYVNAECITEKGDCVTVDPSKKYYCKTSCSRNPKSCRDYEGIDRFGKEQKYQCHCKHLSDCNFEKIGNCKNGCLPGYEEPFCQRRKYHEFIGNDPATFSYLFSSGNTVVTKPPLQLQFRNPYRINTVKIYCNYSDSTINVAYPYKMNCKLKQNKNITICSGDVTNQQLYINGKAGIYHIKLYGCPPELYGKKCNKKCHCSNGQTCHQISGICESGCEDGWHGEKCDNQTYVNIAQGKNTYQTSSYGKYGTKVFHNGTCNNMKIEMASGKAVDGNYDPGYGHKSCASTKTENNPYWKVIFDKPYIISQLRIYNRIKNRDRLRGFKVYLESSLCFESKNDEHKKEVILITCNPPVNSSNVEISVERYTMLTLCEVEVLQCLPGFYGNMCKERCELCLGVKCDQVTGHCEEGCVTGYYNVDNKCKECHWKKFGPGCNTACHCSHTCNHINGSCPGSCYSGYYGFNCQKECEEGQFGVNCNKTCHCVNNKNCHRQSGRCSDRCSAGYLGDNCQQECYWNKFGPGCNTACHCSHTCNHINGSCPGSCYSGYYGFNCQKECEEGQFGVNCNKTCHCFINKNCNIQSGRCSDGCSAGYLGDNCQQECDGDLFGVNCKKTCHCIDNKNCDRQNGRCSDGCSAGYRGDNCQQECDGDLFGVNCKKTCHCIDNKNCDRQNGRCSDGCSAGYRGDNCQQECDGDLFGVNCKKTCHCIDNKNCDRQNGRCSDGCSAGYRGDNCQQECDGDLFGVNCKKTCHCIDNKNCDRQNGICSDGCSAGYRGDNCQQECDEGHFGVNCLKTCLCANNKNCDRKDGRCSDGCTAGYLGDNCQQECSNGTFGRECKNNCHCSKKCNHINGSCPGSCDEGYYEYNCQKEKSFTKIMVIGVALLILFIFLILGMAAAIWYCKRRSMIKCDNKNLKISGSRHSEDIPDDRAHIYEEIQMNESEAIYVNVASSSFKSNLQQFVSQKKKEVEPFNDEFLTLPKTLPLPYTEATTPENMKKNRYKTILPYDHSRVKLLPDEISSLDYINANFINNKRYIACQGPIQSTVTDFWRMIYQLKCNTIVMLTDIVENGKMKCIQYWPDEETTESFGTIQITQISASCHSTYMHRRFIISKPSVYQNDSWTIDHFFFNKWPDHGIPQHTEYILEFRNLIKYRVGITFPLVVHCSAGVGRTGTYICIDILLNEMLNSDAVDVLATIRKLRGDRMHMVQKRIQLEFIYDVLVENILTRIYDIDVDNIPIEFSRIKEIDHLAGISILEQQFKDLISQVDQSMMNISSNKGEEHLPKLNNKSFLLNGPSCENEFLVTKTPEEDTTLDFLNIITKRGYLNIVSFMDSSENPPNYLPKKLKESVKYGPYHIELTSVEEKDICIHSVLEVKFHINSRIEEFQINHFLSTIWVDGNYPSCADILKLSDILSSHQKEQFNKKMAVHCSENFHKSGLLCIIHILKAAITSQAVINIVRLVRLIKKIQPKMVADCDSYAFVWEVAEYLLKESALYSNVVQ